jgi:hypothetical protein
MGGLANGKPEGRLYKDFKLNFDYGSHSKKAKHQMKPASE